MSRPLRIEYAGAWYHVMNRGTAQKLIFYRDQQRILFLPRATFARLSDAMHHCAMLGICNGHPTING